MCVIPAPLQKNLTPFPSSMVMISALPSVCNVCNERSSIHSSKPWNSAEKDVSHVRRYKIKHLLLIQHLSKQSYTVLHMRSSRLKKFQSYNWKMRRLKDITLIFLFYLSRSDLKRWLSTSRSWVNFSPGGCRKKTSLNFSAPFKQIKLRFKKVLYKWKNVKTKMYLETNENHMQ